MNEYELTDMLNSTVDLLIDTFSLYLAVTSAYLVCAYSVGSRMTTFQSLAVSVLYFVSATVATIAIFFQGSHAAYLGELLFSTNPDGNYGAQMVARNALSIVCAGGIPTSLKLMWDVRQPKTE